MREGSEFFYEQNLAAYRSGRYRKEGPNESLEKPVFLGLVGEVKGKDILDLGCGDAMFGKELLAAGGKSYLGLDASEQMVAFAHTNLQGTPGGAIHTKIEDWSYPRSRFDLVISRLALHYVADLNETFNNVYSALRPGGIFVFSIVHPVITSSDKSREGGGMRQDWTVDNYFTPGPRKVYFNGEFVKQYHRPVEDIYGALQDTQFQVEALRESHPRRENFSDMDLYERRKRIPLFLFLSARKKA